MNGELLRLKRFLPLRGVAHSWLLQHVMLIKMFSGVPVVRLSGVIAAPVQGNL